MMDYMFYIDFVLNFFTCWELPLDGGLVEEHSGIAYHYAMSGWLFIDFVATVPFDDVLGIFMPRMRNENNSSEGRSAKLIRITRIVKVARMLRLLRAAKIGRMLRKYEVRAR